MGRWPRHLFHLTRREALGLLGAGAGFALTAGPGRAAPAQQAAGDAPAAPSDIAFPAGAVIRAILEDLAPEALGAAPRCSTSTWICFRTTAARPWSATPRRGR